jgi:peptide/nickel transport system permease protein
MSAADAIVSSARARRARLAGSNPLVWSAGAILAAAVVAALLGPLLAPADPNAADLNNQFVGPVPGHPLGFDGQGRDLLSRLLEGARTTMVGPAVVVAVAMTAGVLLAVVAAWRGGWVDSVIGTALDILFAFPGILLAILSAAVFGASLWAATLALAIAYTPYIARVLRSAAVRERAQEYIAAGEVQGLSAAAVCVRHLIPNIAPLIVAQATLLFGYAMVDLAAISFLGLGVQPPQADWGVMVATGKNGVLQGYPAESLSAGLCIVLVVVAVNLLGERLGDRREARA